MTVAGAPTANRAPGRAGGWRIRIPADLDVSTYSPSHFLMLVVLEGLCGSKSYCWPSNATLGARYGCHYRRAKAILVEMQHAGILWRLPVDADRPDRGRAGIFLHRRLDPDRPVEDRPPPPEAVRRLWEARGRSDHSPPPGSKSAPPPGSKSAPPPGSNSNPLRTNSLSLNETHPERGDAALAQRQRPETPDSPAVPVVPALPPAAAATPPAPPPREAAGAAKGPSTPAEAPGRVSEPASGPGAPSLTAGQEEFLASLGDPGRAAFDALPPEKRAEVLAPHAAGYDRVIGGEQARRLSPPAEVAPPPIPRTTGELIEMLPGAPRSWSQMAAEAMVQDFGAAKDRRLWGQFVLIAEAIRAGDLDAAPVLDAYGQAMRPGIRARGAKFWAAFKGLTGIDGPPFHRRE